MSHSLYSHTCYNLDSSTHRRPCCYKHVLHLPECKKVTIVEIMLISSYKALVCLHYTSIDVSIAKEQYN